MRITFASSLNERETVNFHASHVYQQALRQYAYSPLAVQYFSQYFPEYKSDYSTIVWNEERPILWIPIYSDDSSFSYFSMPVKIFEDRRMPSLITNAYKYFFKWLREFFKKENFQFFIFSENPYLLNDFFYEISFSNEQLIGIVDLHADLSVIKSCFRKSFKSLINWGEKNLSVAIVNEKNYEPACINVFQDFHQKIAGRKTRNDSTWEIQGEMIAQGYAFATLGYLKGDLVSAGLFTLGLTEAYYAVGVYDRELMEQKLPLAHYSIFMAIQEAKRLNLKEFNIGDITLEGNDEKQSQIARFKRGFVSQCRTEKFYKVDLCQ